MGRRRPDKSPRDRRSSSFDHLWQVRASVRATAMQTGAADELMSSQHFRFSLVPRVTVEGLGVDGETAPHAFAAIS